MGKMHKDKGARGEGEWRDFLRAEGFTARRGRQFSGSPDSPDVVCDELSEVIHFEVKRTERFRMQDAMSQAIGDAGTDKLPVVVTRKNHGEWLVLMRAEDWAKMVREYVL